MTKKLIRSALWALSRSRTQCRHMHHGKNEGHGSLEACPVEAKIDFVIEELNRALREAMGEESRDED